jgi:hypothetical protein
MKCDQCGEEEFVYGCCPSVAVGYPWLCRNPRTYEDAKASEFTDALSTLVRIASRKGKPDKLAGDSVKEKP